MAKFNLENLPKCGAKTRSGKPCQRYGNKTNGRCKLHGGRSTGAKTKEGKFAVRINALLNSFVWYFDNRFYMKIKKSDLKNALTAYLNLIDLSHLESDDLEDKIHDIIQQYRVELEICKYRIAEYEGTESLLLIQSALDHYYKDIDSQHLHFHIYTPVYPTPFFHRTFGSKAEAKQQMKRLAYELRKRGVFYSGRVYPSPMQKEIKKRLKEFKTQIKAIK